MKTLLIACVALFATAAHAEKEAQYIYDKEGVIVGQVGSPFDVNAEEGDMEEIKDSLRDAPRDFALTGLSPDEQAFVENDPASLTMQAGTRGFLRATVDKVGGKYMLIVTGAPGGDYKCLASPGNPAVRGAVATPRFQNKQPYAANPGIHIVSKRKKYAGAKMPYPVWISGGFAIHGGDGGGPAVTGRRESHGCIRVACAQKFNKDVRRVGLGSTRITVRTN